MRRTRTAAQETDRLGAPDGPASPPLDAASRAGACRRQQLCRAGAACGAGAPRRDRRDPAAPGRRPLRTGCAAPPGNHGAPAGQGPAPADPRRRPHGGDYALAAHACAGLVRRLSTGSGGIASSSSAPPPPCGTTPGCRSYRSAGFCCAILWAGSIRRRCCAPTPRASRCRSSPGTSGAGRSRSPLSLSKSREVRDHLGVETQRQWSERAIARSTPRENTMVRPAASSDVERMDGIVPAHSVQPYRELWRQALIDEQPHAERAQGRPPGRPMNGCVRA